MYNTVPTQLPSPLKSAPAGRQRTPMYSTRTRTIICKQVKHLHPKFQPLSFLDFPTLSRSNSTITTASKEHRKLNTECHRPMHALCRWTVVKQENAHSPGGRTQARLRTKSHVSHSSGSLNDRRALRCKRSTNVARTHDMTRVVVRLLKSLTPCA